MKIMLTISVPHTYILKGESLEAIKNGDYEVEDSNIDDQWLVEQGAEDSFVECIENGEFEKLPEVQNEV